MIYDLADLETKPKEISAKGIKEAYGLPCAQINTYDIDGVIYMGEKYEGIRPNSYEIIITGRSYEEADETIAMLKRKGIDGSILIMNPLRISEKTRETSGKHKAYVISLLKDAGFSVGIHFEDDPIQMREIKAVHPEQNVVLMVHDLTEK